MAIQDLQFPARIGDRSPLLDILGGIRDGGAPHSEHLGEQLLFEVELIAFCPVRGVKQPAAEALFDQVKRIAGGRDPSLVEQYVSILEA